MLKSLQKFLREHPEYFEGAREGRLVREDMRGLFEEYAQAIDPVEYANLKKRVEAYHEKAKARLQEDLQGLVKEREKEQGRLDEIQGELKKFEQEVQRLERQLASAIRSMKPVIQEEVTKSWYNASYIFIMLDFLGVFFLYVGLILYERLTLSYVALGAGSIVLAMFLQKGGGHGPKAVSAAETSALEGANRQAVELQQVSRIKRITLANRRRDTLNRITDLNKKIESNLNRINEHHT